MDVDKQKVDYEDSDHEIRNNVSEGQGDRPSSSTTLVGESPDTHEMAQVQPSNSYGFD